MTTAKAPPPPLAEFVMATRWLKTHLIDLTPCLLPGDFAQGVTATLLARAASRWVQTQGRGVAQITPAAMRAAARALGAPERKAEDGDLLIVVASRSWSQPHAPAPPKPREQPTRKPGEKLHNVRTKKPALPKRAYVRKVKPT